MSTVDIGVVDPDVEGIGIVVPDADAEPPRGAETNRVDEDNDSKIDFDDEAALARLDEAIPWFNPAAPPDDGLTRPGRGIRWALKCEMKVGGVAVFGPAALTYGTIIAVSATVSASCCQCKLHASSGSGRSPVIFAGRQVGCRGERIQRPTAAPETYNATGGSFSFPLLSRPGILSIGSVDTGESEVEADDWEGAEGVGSSKKPLGKRPDSAILESSALCDVVPRPRSK